METIIREPIYQSQNMQEVMRLALRGELPKPEPLPEPPVRRFLGRLGIAHD